MRKILQKGRVRSACLSCLFNVGFSQQIRAAYFKINCSLLGAESKTEKHLFEQTLRHVIDGCRCWKM